MYHRIILVGPGASGKDYARHLLCEHFNMKFGCTCTTRPKRQNEIDGIDYHFLTKEDFKDKLFLDDFYTWMTFKNGEWYYGRDKKDFYNLDNNLIIMAPGDIRQILEQDREKCLIVYFNISEETRRQRMNERNDADIVDRRLQTDYEDFKTFGDFDIEINKDNFSLEDLEEIFNTFKNGK